ncbi:DASH complex subunit spc19 [Sporothrix epigloea]|uniref:DASH complex subunit SPC19 n=1 Tax=Sporothrix epigloea TaxID=1892477 RepID=A0ABP0DX14_9PEZI
MAFYSQPPPSQTVALYGDCVASLRDSLARLESAVTTLSAPPCPGQGPPATCGAVADMPRFSRVVQTVRHYELVPQPTLAAAEASLQNEIGPAVASLLERAEHQLARQARRIDTLQARAALQAGRLEDPSTSTAAVAAAARRELGRANGQGSSSKAGSAATSDLRARMIHQRKEQLKYSVERLEREVTQKERELRQRLRQSMAG